jgi:hypothetical protein
MTVIWFIFWLLADLIGDRAPLRFDPMNVWAATLILAIALDVNRPPVIPRRKRESSGRQGHAKEARDERLHSR